MVLFDDNETHKLLQLYAALQQDPANVTSSGLLKIQARKELAKALSASFGREWSESQVAVKAKNLRGEYAEYKWLTEQRGFESGELSDEWWRDIKATRPKAHAFKGKLPWPHVALMEQIMGRAGSTQGEEQEAQDSGETRAALVSLLSKRRRSDSESSSAVDVGREQQHLRAVEPSAVDVGREQQPAVEQEQSSVGVDREQQRLRAVEQSAAAAAGMARSVQDLVAMMQEKAMQCRELQQRAAQKPQDGALAALVAAEQETLASIARSLEHSSRASADLARGYCKIIERFEQETTEEH